MDKFLDLFSFEGRANRAWYFWHIILDDLAMVTLLVMFVVLSFLTGTFLFVVPGVMALIAGFWAGIAITVKRFHDLGRSGWQWFLLFVPLVNIYIGLILLFAKGTIGPNEFGRDPLAAAKVDGYLGA